MKTMTPADVAAHMKVRAKRMQTADVLDAFKGRVRDEPDGRHFKIDLGSDRRAIDKLRELRRPHAKAAAELNAERSAKEARMMVRSPRGGVVQITADSERAAAKQGFLPAIIWSPVRRFAGCPRRYFPCGHYTETAGETACAWCADGE